MSEPEPEHKISLPVQFLDGELTYLGGLPLPRIRERAVLDLVVPARDLLDRDFAALLLDTRVVNLLPANTVLFASVRADSIPSDLQPHAHPTSPHASLDPTVGAGLAWVAIRLDTPLPLRVGGGTHPELLDCTCTIPALSDREARSVNHAYTLISEAFEPRRRSHTGNVFQRVYLPEAELSWISLGRLRDRYDVVSENHLCLALLLDALGLGNLLPRATSAQLSLSGSHTEPWPPLLKLLNQQGDCLIALRDRHRHLLPPLSLFDPVPPHDLTWRHLSLWTENLAATQCPPFSPTTLAEFMVRLLHTLVTALAERDVYREPALQALLGWAVATLTEIWRQKRGHHA